MFRAKFKIERNKILNPYGELQKVRVEELIILRYYYKIVSLDKVSLFKFYLPFASGSVI